MRTNGQPKKRREISVRPETEVVRAPGLPVGGSELDELVRAAWLYYMAGHTQERTAEILGVSRVKAARLLAEAREAGIVKISVEHRLTAMAEVEERLRRRFGLTSCRVTPPLSTLAAPVQAAPPDRAGGVAPSRHLAVENEMARRAVGMTAARLLRERLQASNHPVVGLGWGRTTAAMVDQLSGVRKPEATFVSTMGSLTLNSAANLFEVVHRLAEKTGGEGHFLPVPFIANSVADRDTLMSQRVVREALALAARADFFLISLGECDENAFLFENRYLSAEELTQLRQAGAVGDTMGKFFDRGGRAVDTDLNHRTLAIDLRHLYEREVILLCAGRTKARAARGILRTGFVNGLIVDGDTALQICAQEEDG